LNEISDQLFLLRIHRDHRLAETLELSHFVVKILELSIPIRMMAALTRLAVGLKAITEPIEQTGYRLVAGGMTLVLQFLRQFANALASPPQRRLWITASHRLQKLLQIHQQ
jgi:hypothetical protein